MREDLLRQLDRMNSSLDLLFDELAQYNHEQLNKQPAPDSWCATQVLNHLFLSEKYSQQYCEKKLSFDPELPTAGMMDKLRTVVVRSYFALPLKIQAPKAISTAALARESKLSDLRASYQEQRRQLAQFLSTVDEKYLDKAVYKHPFAGRLSISGMLHFFVAHFAHHRKQIRRAVTAASAL